MKPTPRYDWPLILAYHSVSETRNDALAVHVRDFEFQMSWLRRHGYRSMTMADFMRQDVRRGERVVIITFDDGYADNHAHAFPALKRHGFVATIFLVSDLVGTTHVHWWDVPKITPPADRSSFELMTWEQVREMADYGVEFGSHTCTHPRLTQIEPDRRREEIARSRVDLEARLGREVLSFCYPEGDLDAETIAMVRDAGYSSAVVTPPRPHIPLTAYTQRRVGIYYHTSPMAFRLKVAPLFMRYYERIRWLRPRPSLALGAG